MTRSPRTSPEPIRAPRRRDAERTLAVSAEHRMPQVAAPRIQLRRGRGWLLLALLAGVLAAVLIPGALGVYYGLQDRQSYLHGQAVEHFQRALAYESENDLELALAELQLALRFEPGYQPALDKLDTLQGAGPAPATAAPTADPSQADQLFRSAQDAIANQQWNEAIDFLEKLTRTQPNYRAGEAKVLLIQTYVNAGKESIIVGDIEQAHTRFEEALKLDPANAQATSLQSRTRLYLNGLKAIGADWPTAILNFQQLYAIDPAFYDVKEQLAKAQLGYAEFAIKQGAPCIAARAYEQALSLGASGVSTDKLRQLNANCKQLVTAPTFTPRAFAVATPVPIVTPTRVARTIHFTPQGALDTASGCQGTGIVTGHIRDAHGNPLTSLTIQIYSDNNFRPLPVMSQGDGSYLVVLGAEPGLYHLVILNADGTPASPAFDMNYPGGNGGGCHWIVDWIRNV